MLVKTPNEKIGIHLMAKAPLPGWCMTRLQPELEHDRSAQLQEALLYDSIARVQDVDIPANLWIGTPFPPASYRIFGVSRTTYLINQSLKDVLKRAYRACTERSWGKALFLGTDAPVALHAHLKTGINELRNHDLVLGPTHDGGVYLIGLNARALDPFSSIEWGTDQVFAQLQEYGVRNDLKASFLPHENDVDTFSDLRILYEELQRAPEIAPLTHKLLSSWTLF